MIPEREFFLHNREAPISGGGRGPGFGDRRRPMLDDLAVVTGGRVSGGELGVTLENVAVADGGPGERVVVVKDDTTIFGGTGE